METSDNDNFARLTDEVRKEATDKKLISLRNDLAMFTGSTFDEVSNELSAISKQNDALTNEQKEELAGVSLLLQMHGTANCCKR